MTDKRYRSLLKAVSYRLTGTLVTIGVSFLVIGRVKPALSIGLVELVSKIGVYYLHERIWERIPVGRRKPREDYSI